MNEKELIKARKHALRLCLARTRAKTIVNGSDTRCTISFGEVKVGIRFGTGTVCFGQPFEINSRTDLMSIAQELIAAELFMLNVREKFRVIDDEAQIRATQGGISDYCRNGPS